MTWDSPEGLFAAGIFLLLLMTAAPVLIPSVRATVTGWANSAMSWAHDYRPASIDDIPVQPEGSPRGYSSAAFGEGLKGNRAVSLPEAWRSGASSWTRQQRVAFASDPDTLVPSGADHCTVVNKIVEVKYHYRLSMDPREDAAVRADLAKC